MGVEMCATCVLRLLCTREPGNILYTLAVSEVLTGLDNQACFCPVDSVALVPVPQVPREFFQRPHDL